MITYYIILLWYINISYTIADDYRVAYIFAGSARSFLSPFVRKSIQINLIQSFCPPTICSYDIFIRVSANDNIHTGIDASGVFIPSNHDNRQEITKYMNEFQPHDGNKLFVEYYDIGSKEETDRMIADAHDNVRHKIYRELDSRRYSMYYGRWKAYMMMQRYEEKIGKKYTWVVHARLDAAWGAPIPSVDNYLPNHVYAPDSWHVEIPDTFAIMTRNIAGIYFGLEEMMHHKVFCLGGPNLDTRKLAPDQLRSSGYSSAELDIIYQEDCRNRFPEFGLVVSSRLKLNWTTAGYSEFFLKRKLMIHGYNIQDNSIILQPYFMMLVRPPQDLNCFYLEPYHLISWLKVKQAANSAIYAACLALKDDLQRYDAEDKDDKKKICAPNDGKTKGPTRSCLLQYHHSNMNFLPYRIRSYKRCMTMHHHEYEYHHVNNNHHHKPHDMMINMSSCVNYKRVDRFMETYDQEQLYHLYPLISSPQKIIQYNYYDNRVTMKRCLSAIISSSSLSPSVRIGYDSCQRTSDRKYPSSQMFRIIIIDDDHHQQNDTTTHHHHDDADDHSIELKPLTSIIIQWQYPPSGDIYCLTSSSSSSSSSMISSSLDGMNLMLKKCMISSSSLKSRYHPSQMFVLERARMNGNPYRPGIVAGPYPTWSDK